MACTYEYATGKITLDFHLVKYDEICELRGLKGKAGVEECHRCPFYGGTHSDWDEWKSFVKCKHPDAKDSDGSFGAKSEIYDEFEREALTHMYD